MRFESSRMTESECSSTVFRMPSMLNSMGLDYYISPDLPGFLGTIKQIPEDFIVTEIDSDGKMVTLDPYSELPSKPAPVLPSEDEVERPRKGARPVTSEVPPLEHLVTPEQHQSIQELAETYKTSLNPHPKQNILLGSFSEKDARAAIHVAVRLAFPVLETRTSRDKEGVSQIHVVPDPKFVRLRELLGATEAEKLLSFLNLSEKSAKSIHFLPSDESKEHRAKVHQLLSELYGYLVTTRTFTAEHGSRRNKRQKLNPKQQGTSSDQDQLDDYSTPQVAVKFRVTPNYKKKNSPDDTTVKFVLYKRNTECFRAIQQLCDILECYPSQFSFSGTKDRRAITTQHMTVRGVAPERIQAVNSQLTNIQTGNYQYTNTHIQLGNHSGNHFKIVLRQLRSHEGSSNNVKDVIPLAMEPLKQTGFVNYFGPQRFGWSLHTAKVGLAMIQENYKAAIDNILEIHEDSKSTEALDAKKYYFATRDAAGALERMPSFCTKEIYVLKALQRHGHSKHGYINALMCIPFKFRKLYLESVSSVVWNHLATYRMQEYGAKPVEGDLVISEEDWTSQQPVVSAKRDCVHTLTSNDIQTGRYSIREVVLPLLGTNTIFPRNRVADRLKELLIAAGISLASFRLRGFQMHLPGSYRKLIAHPKQLSWKWLEPPKLNPAPSQASSYSSCGPSALKTESTDLHVQSERQSISSCVSDKDCTSEDVSKKSHPNLEISFTLEKSCYATVLLRELMKHV